jgi:hypothetical protein
MSLPMKLCLRALYLVPTQHDMMPDEHFEAIHMHSLQGTKPSFPFMPLHCTLAM